MLTQYYKDIVAGVQVDRDDFGSAENVSHETQVEVVAENIISQVGRIFEILCL